MTTDDLGTLNNIDEVRVNPGSEVVGEDRHVLASTDHDAMDCGDLESSASAGMGEGEEIGRRVMTIDDLCSKDTKARRRLYSYPNFRVAAVRVCAVHVCAVRVSSTCLFTEGS